MVFASKDFLLAFFPLFALTFWLGGERWRPQVLLASSVVFYAWWNWRFTGLLAFSILFDYWCGARIYAARTKRSKRHLIVASVIVNLSLLGFFKYFMFFNRSLSDFGALVGYHWPAALVSLTILLPIGISFYSFHAISYALDIYYGKVKPARSLLEFAVYITMFPQLIAGPIVRYSDVVNQLNRPLYSGARIYAGFQFFILGLAKKVLIADFASTLVDSFFAQGPAHFPPLHVAVAVLAYSVQIYFDFSGYSDMAIGLGYFIGFQLPINFNSPYKAVSFSDFWRRWHISLSTFLRDYLYFSLGGNRGSTLSTYRNLFLTMLLGGLWHGASWNFVIWGGAHGLLLAVERLLGDRNPIHRLPTSLQVACTFLCVSLIWVFFRAPNLPSSLAVFKALFVPHQATEAIFVTGAAVRAGVITAFGLLLAFGVKNTNQISQTPSVLRTATLATLFVVSIVALFMSQEHPFLYFQF